MRSAYWMAALALAASGAAMADTVIFSDNFNGENGGVSALNYTGFANWTVSNGTVDIIRNQEWGFVPAANGQVVDLDGSTGDAGVLTTSNGINFVVGYTYKLEFDIAGNGRGAPNDQVNINISVNNLNESLTLSSGDAFTTKTYYFVAGYTPGFLSFSNAGGDNIGALLDNVTVTLVPAPQAAGVGLLGLGLVASRRRLAKLVKRA